MPQPMCPECQRPMDGGFLLETTQGGYAATQWVAGPPEKSFWTGLKLKRRKQITVYAWRCPGCTQVRLYAPE